MMVQAMTEWPTDGGYPVIEFITTCLVTIPPSYDGHQDQFQYLNHDKLTLWYTLLWFVVNIHITFSICITTIITMWANITDITSHRDIRSEHQKRHIHKYELTESRFLGIFGAKSPHFLKFPLEVSLFFFSLSHSLTHYLTLPLSHSPPLPLSPSLSLYPRHCDHSLSTLSVFDHTPHCWIEPVIYSVSYRDHLPLKR